MQFILKQGCQTKLLESHIPAKLCTFSSTPATLFASNSKQLDWLLQVCLGRIEVKVCRTLALQELSLNPCSTAFLGLWLTKLSHEHDTIWLRIIAKMAEKSEVSYEKYDITYSCKPLDFLQ